jgi:hypothetical protein
MSVTGGRLLTKVVRGATAGAMLIPDHSNAAEMINLLILDFIWAIKHIFIFPQVEIY